MDTLKVAKRLEAELGDEQASFIEGEPGDWDLLPPPEGFFKVGIDGGYVRNWFDKKHKFEVIVGKSIRSFAEDEEDKTPSLKHFGFVQTLDTKSKHLMEKTHTQRGLKVFVHVLDKVYETGRKATETFKYNMPIIHDEFLSQWNYRAILAFLSDGKVI